MTKEKEMEGEEERGELYRHKRTGVISGSSSHGDQLSLGGPTPKRACFFNMARRDYYSRISPLIDEMEIVILARIPISELGKVCLLNKRYQSLFKNGELFKIRRELGVRDLCVFMLATGDKNWWTFDCKFMSRKRLPELPADPCFIASDKETLCAGTHLIVSGRETNGPAIWRYELAMNKWLPGPLMNHPRCLFASTTCGNCAFVAGGIGTGFYKGILDSAEKYDPDTKKWERLPDMNEKRKLCSGFYMDDKFYVLGGQNERGESLTCGEVFHEERNAWVKIPGILKDSPVGTSESPPLLAVVSNRLYSIETSSNQLKVYMKESDSWKKLGMVPVITDFNRGWGVAFKSLGDELLVMGGGMSMVNYTGHGLAAFTCRPDPNTGELTWKLLTGRHSQLSHFILNCSVMAA